jgi:hypothetical protein
MYSLDKKCSPRQHADLLISCSDLAQMGIREPQQQGDWAKGRE